MIIKYLCIYPLEDYNICLREDNNSYYIDMNKNNLYVNLTNRNKSDYNELINNINKENEKQTYITILTSIISDFLLNVK